METKTNYFETCTTLDSAKNLFNKLCFKLHPDTSKKDTEQEFIKMFKEFKNFRPTAEHANGKESDFNFDDFYNIVRRFQHLENVLISFIGSFIWLEDEAGADGATKAQKEEIKSILLEGFNNPRFSGKRKTWFYSPVGYKQKFRSKKSFEELKTTWGNKTYNAKEAPKQYAIS